MNTQSPDTSMHSRHNVLYIIGVVAACAAIGLAAFALGLRMWGTWHDDWSGYTASTHISDGVCNIAVIPLVGDIIPYAEAYGDGSGYTSPVSTNPDDFSVQLQAAENDPMIQGILVRIDSYGGTPVASEVIARAIKSSQLPIAALIREAGTSGAYLAATGADIIFASPLSDVGSIGITMSYLDNSRKNEREGIEFVSLSSGIYKDAGNPDKPVTAAERALTERDLKVYHEEFVRQVAENRGLTIEEVAKLADGSSMPGAMALEKGLIDKLGSQDSTKPWFAQETSLPVGEIAFCENF